MENKEGAAAQSMQMNSVNSVRARRTTAASFKYMRNKPTVISLKTPSYEENYENSHHADMNIASSAVVGIIGCEQKLAEEGRLGGGAGGGKDKDGEMDLHQLDPESNELHPILGTTNTKHHGSLAVGRSLEVTEK